ncbi:hypothetical protein B0H14DRAFT_2597370 [Mycena olivaceomarginata]|nr:hypothetical protein B0H14DRAFT_2597370 [Mycena olivaceomarginata]
MRRIEGYAKLEERRYCVQSNTRPPTWGGHHTYLFCFWNKTPPQRIQERELPYVSVKTELASGSVGGKLLFRQVKWTVMIKNGNQESNKESWTYTLEVNTGIVTVRDEPNFWGEKGDLWRATKSVGGPRPYGSTKERASSPNR